MKYLIFCTALSLFFGCSNPKSETVVFGFVPTANIEAIEVITDSLCNEISAKSGLKVKSFVAPDYASLIESIRTKHVQIAWFTPMSYVEAEKEADLSPLLTAVRGGKPYFYSSIFVRRDSRINSIADLKGKIMGFTDPTSTTGRIFSEAEIRKQGYNPETFFKEVLYLGGHDKVVMSVLDGTVDAGASFANDTINVDNAWHQFIKNKTDADRIRPILYSTPIPGDLVACLTSLKDQDSTMINLFQNSLLKSSAEPTGSRLLKKLNHTDALTRSNRNDYQSVRETAKLVLGE